MIGNAHTVPTKVHGKSGSVRIRMIPAPRGTGIVAAPASKKKLYNSLESVMFILHLLDVPEQEEIS